MPRARRQHQRVVSHRAAVFEQHAAIPRVDARHRAEQRRDFLALAHQVANRPGDFRGCQRRGADLVQQRLEQMMIALIDDGDA